MNWLKANEMSFNELIESKWAFLYFCLESDRRLDEKKPIRWSNKICNRDPD